MKCRNFFLKVSKCVQTFVRFKNIALLCSKVEARAAGAVSKFLLGAGRVQ
jgi:hypothetical protein